jgi:demethylmenaquinone methyltransferase/2-methoxy-6-polyprenyl-1,4-benzoquinol methylase
VSSRPSYNPAFVKQLFDEMAATYGLMNLISSFGFARRWRRQCLGAVPIRPGDRVLDLMTGMGELIPDAARRVGGPGSVTAVDISPRMCDRARRHADGRAPCPVRVIEADVLATWIVISSIALIMRAEPVAIHQTRGISRWRTFRRYPS